MLVKGETGGGGGWSEDHMGCQPLAPLPSDERRGGGGGGPEKS